MISFPTAMTTWYQPFIIKSPSIMTAASPLSMLSEQGIDQVLSNYSYWEMFVGKIPGSIGEVSALALIIGFIYLLVRNRVKVMIPLSYIGTVVVFSSILYFVDPIKFGNPLFHILTGGLMLGALLWLQIW